MSLPEDEDEAPTGLRCLSVRYMGVEDMDGTLM